MALFLERVASVSRSTESLPSSNRSSGTSVIIGPDVNGCVFKLGIGGGCCECVEPGITVTTLRMLVVVVLSDGNIRASDGLLFNAVIPTTK